VQVSKCSNWLLLLGIPVPLLLIILWAFGWLH
jgi:hypothetical protein